MTVTIEIADDIARQLAGEGADLNRQALEAIAFEGYRTGKLGDEGVRVLLGLESRFEVWDLLARNKVYYRDDVAEFEKDLKTLERRNSGIAAA